MRNLCNKANKIYKLLLLYSETKLKNNKCSLNWWVSKKDYMPEVNAPTSYKWDKISYNFMF